MELTRKQVIEILEKADSTVYKEPKTKTAQALEYAISSLKTDEAYQIMYEGGEVFTKDEVISILEEVQSEFWNLTKCKYDMQILYEQADDFECDFNCFIQEKIHDLKGEENVDTNTK